jgi:hypothetical protein
MAAGGEEFTQPLRRMWNRIRPRDAYRVKAVGACRFGKRAFDRRSVQKSRLA